MMLSRMTGLETTCLRRGPSQRRRLGKKAVLLTVCVMVVAVSMQAQQAPQGPSKPGPEVKRLAYGIGTWNIEGEAKPFGPMPGGRFAATKKCEWYTGGFFLTCRAEGTGPMGSQNVVSFQGMTRTKRFTPTMSSRMQAKPSIRKAR